MFTRCRIFTHHITFNLFRIVLHTLASYLQKTFFKAKRVFNKASVVLLQHCTKIPFVPLPHFSVPKNWVCFFSGCSGFTDNSELYYYIILFLKGLLVTTFSPFNESLWIWFDVFKCPIRSWVWNCDQLFILIYDTVMFKNVWAWECAEVRSSSRPPMRRCQNILGA